jgi:hypothetical protein
MTDVALMYIAATDVVSKRHRNASSLSAAHENPLPRTVTGVPPSDTPRDGQTDETATAAR